MPFWSTKDAGQKPFTFKIGLGQVIKGWDEGVAGMDLGEIARVQISLRFFVALSALVKIVCATSLMLFVFTYDPVSSSTTLCR